MWEVIKFLGDLCILLLSNWVFILNRIFVFLGRVYFEDDLIFFNCVSIELFICFNLIIL